MKLPKREMVVEVLFNFLTLLTKPGASPLTTFIIAFISVMYGKGHLVMWQALILVLIGGFLVAILHDTIKDEDNEH